MSYSCSGVWLSAESIRKLVKKLGSVEQLRFCYEAGPTGYTVYWQLTALGAKCEVVAPTLVPVLASAGRIRNLKHILVDGASMEPTFLSPSDMDGIVLQDRQIASYAVPDLLVALVTERNVVFALARKWDAFIEGIGWETKSFRQ